MLDDPFVAEYPGVCGGYPVIRESRISVRLVVELTRAGVSVPELAVMWPSVTPDQIQGALDFYARQPARVDEDIARNAQAGLIASRTRGQ